MVRFSPSFACLVALCAVTACFPGIVLQVDAGVVPTHHSAAAKATPIPLPLKASGQNPSSSQIVVGVPGATAVVPLAKPHHSTKPNGGSHRESGSSYGKPKDKKHKEMSGKGTRVRTIHEKTCYVADLILQATHPSSDDDS